MAEMWRHGDVLIARVNEIPEGATPRGNVILAYGEMTGHAHRVESPESAELWDLNGVIFMRIVTANATIVHEEHKPITLPKGVYRVWKQREYTPGQIRDVWD